MANIRLVLLFTVALVATIAPTMANELSIKATLMRIKELHARLAEKILPIEEVQDIMKSLKAENEHEWIVEFSEHLIIEMADSSELDCQRDTIFSRFARLLTGDLNTLLNVCKFVNPQWASTCELNIKRVYRDEQKLSKLGETKLYPEDVEDILRSIEDKEHAKIEKTTVQTLLDQEYDFKLEDCQLEALEIRNSYTNNRNSILVSNLRGFDMKCYRLFSFCAKRITEVFEGSKIGISDEDRENVLAFGDTEPANELRRNGWDISEFIARKGIKESCLQATRPIRVFNLIKSRAQRMLSASLKELKRGDDELKMIDRICSYVHICYSHYYYYKGKKEYEEICDKYPDSKQNWLLKRVVSGEIVLHRK